MDIDSNDDGRQSSSEPGITRPSMHNAPSISPTRRSTRSHRKRRAEGFITRTGPPPFKRVKGDFNRAYVQLLNQDIQDASSGLIHDEERAESEHTQIGAVVWSAAEKNVFFAAVSRLGKDNIAAISARIGTKSELEVRQYLMFLDAAKRRQHAGDEGKRAQHANPRPVDIPAAVEIGAECAAMLEVAADGLALLQEGYEEEVERKRWGSRWLITAPLAPILERLLQSRIQDKQLEDDYEEEREQDQEEQSQSVEEEQDEKNKLEDLAFLRLFHIQNWLQLSDRIFMNSTVSDGNWHAISEAYEPPAIQTTTLKDFYGLALSVTRRLLLAAIYMAESRRYTRGSDGTRKRKAPRIRVGDVTAAAASLGMKRNSREFWARCARRLQLNIVDDETDEETDEDDLTDQENEETDTERSGDMNMDSQSNTTESRSGSVEDIEQKAEESEESDYEIMSYDEVETALDYPVVDSTHSTPSSPESRAPTTSGYISSDSEDRTYKEERAEEEDDDDYESDIKMEDTDDNLDEDLNSDAIKRDIEEAMISLAPIGHGGMDAKPTRQAMKSQIRTEHRLEQDAERLDYKASADAETRLWAVLRGDSGSKSKGHKS
ncbi:hypothetical protein GQX73_g2490 [Xylaria multiplex]|uniref:Myb-like domain-containing protein n=1 Tax=Xylaria multiplex TaxID=323545 RepID=A0A7C8ISC2_9PEZI|nr:hypothetical protein GQX73_g2490 [Xylaria multiplex]